MHTYWRYGIIENLDTVRRIPIGRLWGVQLLITPLTWASPLVFFSLHLLLNLLNSQLTLSERVYQSSLFTIAVELATVLHALGHIVSGKLVGSAMNALLITATRDVNLYDGDQSAIPGRVHLGRALGGPLGNLLMAGICLGFAPLLAPGLGADLAASLISVNLFFGLGGLLPLPSVDGEVIWRELHRMLVGE
jgi:Zn-dependent protease